ncbi:hypothetical protein CK203_040920 [Vitis vinifera]|uniref:Uncharacterized protein n=1 Tax=Vitis vinifera TaxID=29760 RepID=A0A438HV64_VITVI|nr:hypothetical protein CK203_040920 [Vitis vinifera]
MRSEAWVRVLGLPVSLWERDILKRIGDACGGFIDIDYKTEMLEDLQPTMRMVREEKGKSILVSEGEDGGEGYARAGGRVRGLVEGSSLEVRLQSDDGTRGQSSGSGLNVGPDSGLVLGGPHESCGLAMQWALGPYDASGSFQPTALPCESGLTHIGLPPDVGRASKKLIGGARLGTRGPDSPLPCSFLMVTNGLWRPSAKEQRLVENSLRYGIASNFYGPLVCVSPSPPSSFSGRTPLEEYYDRSRVALDASQREVMDRRMIERTPAAMKSMDCWEMMEDNNGMMGASGQDLYLVGEMDPEIRDWREARWEESELARFSQFLGFSTAGLGKDILDFMVKIRKRREKVHSKSLLENSKFERELKRLECSINYDRGRKQKGIVQGRGGQSPAVL